MVYLLCLAALCRGVVSWHCLTAPELPHCGPHAADHPERLGVRGRGLDPERQAGRQRVRLAPADRLEAEITLDRSIARGHDRDAEPPVRDLDLAGDLERGRVEVRQHVVV